jgi:hypothetical protein
MTAATSLRAHIFQRFFIPSLLFFGAPCDAPKKQRCSEHMSIAFCNHAETAVYFLLRQTSVQDCETAWFFEKIGTALSQ